MAHRSASQGVIWIDQLVVNGSIFKARYDAMRKQLNLLRLLYRKSTFRLLPVIITKEWRTESIISSRVCVELAI